MATRSIDLERIPLVSPANDNEAASEYFSPKRHVLKVSVVYKVGEMNYFSGEKPARGYYVSATPVYEQDHLSNGEVRGTMEGFILFSGAGFLLEPAARFSDKTLAKVAATAKNHPKYEALKASVLAKAKMEVAA